MEAEQLQPRAPRKRILGPLDSFDILLLGLMVTTYIAVANLPFAPSKYGDHDFHIEAQNFASFLRGVGGFETLAVTRAPGPSFFYTVPYLLVAPGSPDELFWKFGFAWTVCWMAVALLMIRRASEILGGPWSGKVAGLMVLASPFSVYYSYAITGEPLAYIGVSAFIYGWARWQSDQSSEQQKRRAARLAFLGLVAFMLARPNAALLLPIAGLVALVLRRKSDVNSRAQARFAIHCVLWGALALLLMNVMGRALHGRAGNLRQSDYLRYTVFQGRYQFRDEPKDWRFFGETTRPDSKDWRNFQQQLADFRIESERTGVPVGALFQNFVVTDLKAHPFLFVRQAIERIVFGQITLVNSVKKESFRLGPLRGPFGYFILHLFINLSNLLLLGSSVAAIYLRRHVLIQMWPLWGTFVGLLAFHAVVYMEPRYLFPARVIIAILGSTVLAEPLRRAYARHKERSAAHEPTDGGALYVPDKRD